MRFAVLYMEGKSNTFQATEWYRKLTDLRSGPCSALLISLAPLLPAGSVQLQFHSLYTLSLIPPPAVRPSVQPVAAAIPDSILARSASRSRPFGGRVRRPTAFYTALAD